MPRDSSHLWQKSFQYLNHSRSVPGLQKNSSSICSNSRVRKVKLPGVISLRKDLPIWHDAEGQLLPGGALDVLEVDEDALCRLRTQVHGVLRVLGDALEGLEHQVELTDVGPVVLAAGGAGDVVLLDEVLHLGSGSARPRTCAGQSCSRAHQSSMSLSARKRSLHSLQSIRGSEKPPT